MELFGICDREEYWKNMESRRKNGKLPDKCFDFIGIHEHLYMNENTHWSLSAPLILCSPDKRPDWENERFESKELAIQKALSIAREHNLVVVICKG